MLFIQLVLFTLIGIGLGIITGLIPGIHINTIAAIVLSLGPLISGFDPLSIASLLLGMGVTHTFLDFIPSILLGAPEGETALSVLPGHQMLLQGRGLEAIKLTGLGSLVSLLLVVIVFIPLLIGIPLVYESIRIKIRYILLAVVIFGFSLEKKPIRGIGVFLLSGIFGWLVLSSSALGQDMIFPALSGLFGISTLLLSIKEQAKIPLQIKARITLGWSKILKHGALGGVAGMIVGLLPGIGSAQATYLVQQVSKGGNKEFLVSVSGVNTANLIFTLIVFYTLGKTRSGLIIVLKEFFPSLGWYQLLGLVGSILLTGGIALLLQLFLGNVLSSFFSNQNASNYEKINWGIMLLILGLVIAMTGWIGLVILITGCAIGLISPMIEVRRANAMGFFMVPVLLYYWNLNWLILGIFGVK